MTTDLLADGARLTLTGRLAAVDVRVNRQQNQQAEVRLVTDSGTVDVLVPPRTYLDHAQLLQPGRDVAIDVGVSAWRGTTTVMAHDIRADTPATRTANPNPIKEHPMPKFTFTAKAAHPDYHTGTFTGTVTAENADQAKRLIKANARNRRPDETSTHGLTVSDIKLTEQ